MAVERGPAVVRRSQAQRGCAPTAAILAWLFLLPAITGLPWKLFFFSAIAVIAFFKVILPARRALRAVRGRALPESAPMTLAELHARSLSVGGGAYLATGERGESIWAPPEAAILVLAGPRAGKTSCVVIPAIIAHPGPVLATSTKPEVLPATLAARRQLGRVWFFDLQGHGAPAGTRALRWSPAQGAEDWQRAQLIAEAMAGSADVDSDGAHWRERAGALIASCLHAAARSAQGTRELIGWVLRHDPDAPLAELEPGILAHDVLSGIARTGERERASIFSTAARILRAYRSEIALAAADNPSFDPDGFIACTDTLYIAASGPEQRLLAPLVAGLITDVRVAAYRRHWQQVRTGAPLLLALDECANIAPLPDLPSTLSEGGGQGVQALTVFQDMSQARRRWPKDADGMISMFGALMVMAGIADRQTLEQLSLLCGEYDREIQSITETDDLDPFTGQRRTRESWTTRRERRLPPDEIARLPKGKALLIIGSDWHIVPAIPYHQHPFFVHLAGGPPLSIQSRPAAGATIKEVRGRGPWLAARGPERQCGGLADRVAASRPRARRPRFRTAAWAGVAVNR